MLRVASPPQVGQSAAGRLDISKTEKMRCCIFFIEMFVCSKLILGD